MIATQPMRVHDGFSRVRELGCSILATGVGHTLALRLDGSLWAWGDNSDGQLGDGTLNDRSLPVRVGHDFRAVAAGAKHSAALRSDGSLWIWGSNFSDQIGDGGREIRMTPYKVGDGFQSVAAGGRLLDGHTVAVKTDGSLWAWGSNQFGQLGDGSLQNRNAPVRIGEGFQKIAASGAQSLALQSDGHLWAWGSNKFGQLGDGSMKPSSQPVLVGTGFAAMAAGSGHSLAMKADGTVWSWGAV